MNLIRIFKQDFSNILKSPTLLFSNTVLPVLLILIMGLITRDKFGDTVSSFDYYCINMIILCVAFIAMTATNSFLETKVKIGNSRIAYTPVKKHQVYLSKILATYVTGTICYSGIILIGQFLLKLNYGGQKIGYVLLLINVLTLFFSSLGTMFCCAFKSEEKASAAMQLPVMFFVFFGGVFFALHRLGPVVRAISNLSPLKWVLECIFRMIYDNNMWYYYPILIVIFLFSIGFIVICQITYKPEDYLC